MKNKKIFLVLSSFALCVVMVIGWKLAQKRLQENAENYIAHHLYENVETMESPGCFLPKTKNEIDSLLIKLQKNKNWKVIAKPDSKDQMVVLAYRVFDRVGKVESVDPGGYVNLPKWPVDPKNTFLLSDYSILLVQITSPNIEIPPPNRSDYKGSLLTTALCNANKIKLKTFNSAESLKSSYFLFKNENYGLWISEDSADQNRTFTKEVLKTVSEEIVALK